MNNPAAFLERLDRAELLGVAKLARDQKLARIEHNLTWYEKAELLAILLPIADLLPRHASFLTTVAFRYLQDMYADQSILTFWHGEDPLVLLDRQTLVSIAREARDELGLKFKWDRLPDNTADDIKMTLRQDVRVQALPSYRMFASARIHGELMRMMTSGELDPSQVVQFRDVQTAP